MESPILFFPPDPILHASSMGVHALFRLGMDQDFIENDFAPSKKDQRSALLGTDISTNFRLSYGNTYIDLHDVVMNVKQEKTIVSTVVQGRQGTVKEHISDGDYTVEITASINNVNFANADDELADFSRAYPKNKVTEVHKMLQLPYSLKVNSEFLGLFGIESVVVKTYNLDQETFSNHQILKATLLSDTPYEIQIKEEEDVKTK